MIRRVSSLSRLDRVPVPHTNDACYALTAGGERWVAKREEDMGVEGLLSEALTWLLGRAIGAPVPDAAFCDDPAERTWLSAYVPRSRHWSEALAERLANPTEAGAMLALDALVFNEARHARNVLAQPDEDGRVRIWAIDGDEALIGCIDDYIESLDALPSVHNHARGLPLAQICAGARAAASRVTGLSADVLGALVEAGCALARAAR